MYGTSYASQAETERKKPLREKRRGKKDTQSFAHPAVQAMAFFQPLMRFSRSA